MNTNKHAHPAESRTDSPRKNPRDESNDEALLRFIRGSWYWALAAYVAVITIHVVTHWHFIYWHDIYELTILVFGFWFLYLFARMKFAGRVRPGIYDQFDDIDD